MSDDPISADPANATVDLLLEVHHFLPTMTDEIARMQSSRSAHDRKRAMNAIAFMSETLSRLLYAVAEHPVMELDDGKGK